MSPVATQDIEQARDAALAAADDLFYRRGTSAVSVVEIRDMSGVSLRRLYSMFPSKADLIGGWLTHRHETWMAWLETEVAQRTADGVAPVEAVFDSMTEWLKSSEFRGCAFINTHAETGELTAEHEELIRAHKRALIEFLATTTTRPNELAVIIDGAIVQAAVFKSTRPIESARACASALFGNEMRSAPME